MKIPRWRVRTGLILVAVVALLLAACVSLRNRALARRDAIAAVDRFHGTYGVRVTGPAWYRRLMGRFGVDERGFYDPRRVSFGPMNMGYDPTHPVRDADLAAISGSSNPSRTSTCSTCKTGASPRCRTCPA